jgi:hypothetical protein
LDQLLRAAELDGADYEDLRGDGKGAKVRSLILHLDRRKKLELLLPALNNMKRTDLTKEIIALAQKEN